MPDHSNQRVSVPCPTFLCTPIPHQADEMSGTPVPPWSQWVLQEPCTSAQLEQAFTLPGFGRKPPPTHLEFRAQDEAFLTLLGNSEKFLIPCNRNEFINGSLCRCQPLPRSYNKWYPTLPSLRVKNLCCSKVKNCWIPSGESFAVLN